jgi:hypothetical protein
MIKVMITLSVIILLISSTSAVQDNGSAIITGYIAYVADELLALQALSNGASTEVSTFSVQNPGLRNIVLSPNKQLLGGITSNISGDYH